MIVDLLKIYKKNKMKVLRGIDEGGFTLVELLIVIALIAILSVAVLATINPIEQTNKARDAKYKNDVAEVLGALERYYASKNQYPWNDASFTGALGGPALIPPNSKMTLRGVDPRSGILDIAGDPKGLLIDTSELKSSFGSKEPFVSGATTTDQIYVFNNGSDSNYVCFCPKSKANRTSPISAQLKCASGAPVVGNATTIELTNIDNSACVEPTSAEIATATFCNPGNTVNGALVANLLCVPEGAIN